MNQSRRPAILMAVLLVLILGYVFRPDWMSLFNGYRAPSVSQYHPTPPLPGKNSISNLVVRQNDAGVWEASFDYFYTGAPIMVQVAVRLPREQDSPPQGQYDRWRRTQLIKVERGANHGT